MQKDKQEQRRQQIRVAAYELLEEKGYKGTSMLAIAKRARASNETLYAWYGNKQNLFSTLVQENASEIAQSLENALLDGADLKSTLNRVGPSLLELVTSDKAIALSRAAAADVSDTGVLGKTLAEMGRDTVGPLLHKMFMQAKASGELKFNVKDNVTEVYLGLLIGDLQIRRTTGALNELNKSEIKARSNRALSLFLQLYS